MILSTSSKVNRGGNPGISALRNVDIHVGNRVPMAGTEADLGFLLFFFSSRTIVLVAQQSADLLLNCNRIFYNVLGILSVDGSLSGARQSFCSFI